MKKFTFLVFTALFVFSFQYLNAQERISNATNPSPKYCGTMQYLEDVFSKNPGARVQFEASQSELEKKFKEQIARLANNNNTQRIQAITTIPVVVHIVLPNATIVTDAAVQDQINILNADYSGLNPDSTNATNFFPVRGHSEIRFCLAQRTPTNLPTNGVERRNSSTISEGAVSGDDIKFTANGGLDAWDPNKYLNIWVGGMTPPGSGLILLGYASFPGLGFPLNEHGAVINYRAFSSINPTGTTLYSFANKGRTASHELGHFFNLRHIWGDATGCATDDLISDTPLQDDASSSCQSGTVTDACSPTAPGIMYQNFMDYSDDLCLTLFTNLQAVRMQTALSDPTRIGLTTSNGCVPISLTPDNAGISAVNTPPAGFVTCDPAIPLTVTLRNSGSNTLTSVTITVTANGTAVQTLSLTGLNIASNATQTVPLNAVSLVLGANTIQICTSLPNGVIDTDPGNDCFTITGTRGAGAVLPLIESFEGTTFPPANWVINNPDDSVTWKRTTTGVAHSGIAKAFVDHFNYNSIGQTDDLRTPPYAIGNADSLWVDFWGAYRGYPGLPFDQFQVMVSSDCGQTFQVVYNARNDTAFVGPPGSVPTTATGYYPSATNQWVKKSLNLSNFIPSGNVQLQFRAINQFGNNMHLDDINIDKKIFQNNDAGVILINKPDARVCTSSQAPVVVIKNFGKINLTSVKINYQVDGGAITTFNWTGNLARNQIASVTLASAALGAIGNHSINVFTTLPNNVADQDPSNDGSVKAYSVNPVLPLSNSVTEEFTSTTFPPTNWSIFNPNADMTWARTGTVGKKNPGSAFFDDWNNPTFDRFDDLLMPNYSYSGIDSIFLTFNVAAVSYSLPGTTGTRLDTFAVLLSKDCGNTFTTVYKKWGEDLQTVNDPNFPQSLNQRFIPKANQWRLDSVNLGKWLGSSESMFQVAYRFSGNFENNLYLDDINIRTEVLPVKLKNQGYLVLPNPFRSSFTVWHYQMPTNLRYINVYNSTGQLVYSKQFPGGGEKQIEINLSGKAAGTYTVNIGYDDSNRNVNVQVVKY